MLKSIFNPDLSGKHLTIVLTFVLLLTSFSFANIIRVPQNVSTIQAALDSCSVGDTVLVSPGTYYENIVWPSTLKICLMSEYGCDTTIIDGSGTGSVIELDSISELSTTVISGFAIRNGNSSYEGGGIYCNFSSPIIMNNLIDSNYAKFGGGIGCVNNSNPTIIGNIIRANNSGTLIYGGGGGIFCNASSPDIDSNIISYNQGYAGAGIYCKNYSSPTIKNNVISNNSASNSGGGIHCNEESAPLIIKNSILHNYGTEAGGGISCYRSSTPEIRENTIMYNETDLINGYGGGLDVYLYSLPHIVKNIIGYNKAAFGGGVSCYGASHPVIDSNCIMNNSGDGVYSTINSNPIINYNNIFDNSYGSYFGLRNADLTLTINAKNNWWGDASGPYHPVTNPNGLGDAVSNYVDYIPYLLDSVNVVSIKYLQTVIPDNFVLYQNFPNPFNPTTNIRFDVQQSSYIKLIVFDILGKEVATLVSGKFRAGSYEVDWNASNYPSGVYFYTLQAGEYIETKKMLLLK
ncbi:right-handed parallel beta-helix repeat-containing protein [Bacteroidota bacterium]